jgi:DNA-binding MarR family transcriptional regulator
MSWEMAGRVKRILAGRNGEPISTTDKLLLLILADYHDPESGYAWPSVKILAEQCLSTERTIQTSLRHLEKCNLVKTEMKAGKRSKYFLLPVEKGGENSAVVHPDEVLDRQSSVLSGDASIIEPTQKIADTNTVGVGMSSTEEVKELKPMFPKPQKREKKKKAFRSSARDVNDFPSERNFDGVNLEVVREKSSNGNGSSGLGDFYKELRQEVIRRGGRTIGSLTPRMWESLEGAYQTVGPEKLTQAFFLWWEADGRNLPKNFSKPMALFLKDPSGWIAEAEVRPRVDDSDDPNRGLVSTAEGKKKLALFKETL